MRGAEATPNEAPGRRRRSVALTDREPVDDPRCSSDRADRDVPRWPPDRPGHLGALVERAPEEATRRRRLPLHADDLRERRHDCTTERREAAPPVRPPDCL